MYVNFFFFVDKRHLSFFIYMSQLLQNVVVVFVSDFKLLIRRTSAHSSNTTSFFCVLFESSIPFSIEKGDLIPFICDFFFLFACLLFYNTKKKLLFVRIRKRIHVCFHLLLFGFIYLFTIDVKMVKVMFRGLYGLSV